MRSKIALAFLCLALTSASGVFFADAPAKAGQAPQAQPSQNDPVYQAAIDAGRIDAMVARSEDTADRVLANAMPKEPANRREYEEETVRSLKMAILRYNLLVEGACNADRPNRDFCGAPYLPDWLRAPTSTTYSPDQMQTMIREASARITPLWNTVCARGRTVTGESNYCDLDSSPPN